MARVRVVYEFRCPECGELADTFVDVNAMAGSAVNSDRARRQILKLRMDGERRFTAAGCGHSWVVPLQPWEVEGAAAPD